MLIGSGNLELTYYMNQKIKANSTETNQRHTQLLSGLQFSPNAGKVLLSKKSSRTLM